MNEVIKRYKMDGLDIFLNFFKLVLCFTVISGRRGRRPLRNKYTFILCYTQKKSKAENSLALIELQIMCIINHHTAMRASFRDYLPRKHSILH